MDFRVKKVFTVDAESVAEADMPNQETEDTPASEEASEGSLESSSEESEDEGEGKKKKRVGFRDRKVRSFFSVAVQPVG